ncbi:MAG: Uma2 family endonuclease [Planctomycetes bacterium]|nr:Uma2 family endonuclease [Planctomycetota bacterium]
MSFATHEAGRAHGGLEDDAPLGIAGEADWVLEVVSPSSVTLDRRRLLRKCAGAGVREYWIVDAQRDTIEFDMHALGQDGYACVAVLEGWRESGVFGRGFRLARADDGHGDWQFTLEMR